MVDEVVEVHSKVESVPINDVWIDRVDVEKCSDGKIDVEEALFLVDVKEIDLVLDGVDVIVIGKVVISVDEKVKYSVDDSVEVVVEYEKSVEE